MARITADTRNLVKGTVEPLVAAHGGDSAVAKAVGVHKSTVGRWTKGEADFEALRQLASALRTDIVLTFPGHGHPTGQTKEAPPEWAGQLAEMVADKVVERLATGELPGWVAGRLAERLALPPPPAGEGAPEGTPKPRGGATRAPRRKG